MAKRYGKNKTQGIRKNSPSEAGASEFNQCVWLVQQGNPEGCLRMLALARSGHVQARQAFIGMVMTEFVEWKDWLELEQWCLALLEVIPGDAYYMLGCLYMPGMPGFSDAEQSERYFKLGVERGSAVCGIQLGLLYRDQGGAGHSLKEIRELLESGRPDQKEATIYRILAEVCYEMGDAEAELRYLRNWLRLEPDDAECNEKVAYCYAVGSGCRKNEELALKYYQQAARKGSKEALYTVGMMHLNGMGTRRNAKRGVEFLQRAVAAGSGSACSALAGCYAMGNGVEVDDDESIRLLEEGVRRKDSSCCLELALLYIEEDIIPMNLTKAEELLALAKEYATGHEFETFAMDLADAQSDLESARRMHPTAPDYAAADQALRDGDYERLGELAVGYMRVAPTDRRSLHFAKVALSLCRASSSDVLDEVRMLLRSAAEENTGIALFVGDMYYRGEGMRRNVRSATLFYTHAWQKEESLEAGLRMFLGHYEHVFSKTDEAAGEWLQRLRNKFPDSPVVHRLCGFLHKSGAILKCDDELSAACMRRAVECGFNGDPAEGMDRWLCAEKTLWQCILG